MEKRFCILDLVVSIVIVAFFTGLIAFLTGYVQGESNIERNAVRKGHGTYVVNQFNRVVLEWNEDGCRKVNECYRK